jgi:tRNA(fMet)-specific endonuclease VapC
VILLDTDVCIEILRGNKKVIKKRTEHEDNVAISFMTIAELYYGAEKSGYSNSNIALVDEFLFSVIIIMPDIDILKMFGKLKANLEREGKVIPDADLFIASTALARCNMLITGNKDHYERISGLKIDNWIR